MKTNETMWSAIGTLVLLCLGLAWAAPAAAQPAPAEPEGTHQVVRDRGYVKVGVADFPAAGMFDFRCSSQAPCGVEADIARAIAAAVVGDRDAVEFVPVNGFERFALLTTGEIDVVLRFTTATMGRDAGMDFVKTPYFYDGMGIMMRKPHTDETDLESKTVAIWNFPPLVRALEAYQDKLTRKYHFPKSEVDYFNIVHYPSPFAAFTAYFDGDVDAVATDRTFLAGQRSFSNNPADHNILPVTITKEPLTAMVRQGPDDAQWQEVVGWVIQALVQAEELGVTQANVDDLASTSDDWDIQSLLGSPALGELYGLDADFAVRAIRATGNYGEIYDRAFGPGSANPMPRGINGLWTDDGLMYATPIR